MCELKSPCICVCVVVMYVEEGIRVLTMVIVSKISGFVRNGICISSLNDMKANNFTQELPTQADFNFIYTGNINQRGFQTNHSGWLNNAINFQRIFEKSASSHMRTNELKSHGF